MRKCWRSMCGSRPIDTRNISAPLFVFALLRACRRHRRWLRRSSRSGRKRSRCRLVSSAARSATGWHSEGLNVLGPSVLFFGHTTCKMEPAGMTLNKDEKQKLSRRNLLKGLSLAPLLLRPSPFCISPLLFAQSESDLNRNPALPFLDVRLTPHPPSPLADVLSLVAPGSDEYITEKYAVEVEILLKQWGENLKASIRGISSLTKSLHPMIEASADADQGNSLCVPDPVWMPCAGSLLRRPSVDAGNFSRNSRAGLRPVAQVETAEFEIYGVEQIASTPLTVRLEIRYDIVATRNDQSREERVGTWRTEWACDEASVWIAHRWETGEEILSIARGPAFIDVTHQALGATESYNQQMLRGADHWRTTLDGAVGTDVYSNNGVAVGDFDNDGFDDFYVCQPAGLPIGFTTTAAMEPLRT